jgi:hypothetical protein
MLTLSLRKPIAPPNASVCNTAAFVYPVDPIKQHNPIPAVTVSATPSTTKNDTQHPSLADFYPYTG